MSYQRDREQFYHEAGRIGINRYTADRLLRYASTLQRLAVAQCNGDYPADNGERPGIEYCPICEGGFVRSVFRASSEHKAADHSAHHRRNARGYLLICPDCRTAELVRAVLHGTGYDARIEGDPRGYVLRLIPRGTSDEDYQTGRVRPIYVPGRER